MTRLERNGRFEMLNSDSRGNSFFLSLCSFVSAGIFADLLRTRHRHTAQSHISSDISRVLLWKLSPMRCFTRIFQKQSQKTSSEATTNFYKFLTIKRSEKP